MATLVSSTTHASDPRTAPRMHLDFLDGIRAAAAIFVVLHHSWFEVWPSGHCPRWTNFLSFGHLSVDVFIVLSGFCLMLPVVRGNGSLSGGNLMFFKRRAQRILPPYYFAMALSLLMIFTLIGNLSGKHWDATLPVTWHSLLVHLLLLQNFSQRDIFGINYVFWSISLEWWIYFLFPVLIYAWKRFGAGMTTLAAIAFSYALCWFCIHRFHATFTLQYIALFVIGMLGAEIVYSRHSAIRLFRERLPWGLVACIATVVALLAINGKISHFSLRERSDLLVGFWTMCLLVTLTIRPSNLVSRLLSQKPVVFLGSFAYSLYLIHAPLIQVIWQYILNPLHITGVPALLLLEIVGVPTIIAVAYLFHLAFERPFMSKPGTKIKTEPQTVVAAAVSPAP